MSFLQSGVRSILVAMVIALAFLDYFFRGLRSPGTPQGIRAAWLHRWCVVVRPFVGLKISIQGTPPSSGLVVSNHLGYLDIITLSALWPCLFVAKKEIRDWPLFGSLARNGGTIFVDRESAMALKPTLREVEEALRSGIPVVLFPEGTSSGGESVLPFRSPLLQAAIAAQCQVTAAAVDYDLRNGSVPDEICYWRDMTLIPHLWNLLSKGSIQARVRFGEPAPVGDSRKVLAPRLREQVQELRRHEGAAESRLPVRPVPTPP